jgi:hypothetical protein
MSAARARGTRATTVAEAAIQAKPRSWICRPGISVWLRFARDTRAPTVCRGNRVGCIEIRQRRIPTTTTRFTWPLGAGATAEAPESGGALLPGWILASGKVLG